MKTKHLIALLFTFHTSVGANAQITAGLRGGLNFNQFYHRTTGTGGTLKDISSSNTEYHLGLYGSIPLFRNVRLSPELLYAQRGASLKTGRFPVPRTNIRLDYIEMPVLLSCKIFRGLYADLGPDVSILIATRQQWHGPAALRPRYSDFDIGFNAGARYYVLRKLFLTVRYRAGLLPVQQVTLTDMEGFETGKAAAYNRSWMAGIGFALK